MTLSIWRYAHLVLAVFSALFLIVASVTGVILAADAIGQKIPPYGVENFDSLRLSEVIPVMRDSFAEISEITVDHNQFTTVQGFDADGNEVHVYVNPATAEILGPVEKQGDFIQWITALHRSLFLKETGRFIIGFVSFLLCLIAVSGIVLVIQRQKGLKRFFSKVVMEYVTQYYHVVLGRLMLVPILIIALSGTYLAMMRFELLDAKAVPLVITQTDTAPHSKITDFKIFKDTRLADVIKVEFPFDPEDTEETYTLKLTDREILVSQSTGAIVGEKRYPAAAVVEQLSMDLHTGRTSIIWAVVIGIASLNILYFIYSGFAMTLRRRGTRIKNKFKAAESTIILLAGSENGSTVRFANAVHTQLLANGHKSFLGGLNQYSEFPKAQHIIIMTSTYGLGDAPNNAGKFLILLEQQPQPQPVNVSVVGFGSHSYPDFCGFAKLANQQLASQSWSNMFLPLFTVDDKSPVEFAAWAKAWSSKTGIPLSVTPANYASKPSGLQKMMVLEKTIIAENDHTFMLTLDPGTRNRFASGDLLAIYPASDGRERFYSIGRTSGNIQLAVKLHTPGLGSEYLNTLVPGQVIKARIVKNTSFHFPKKAPKVAMIANGTGIAPFLGMIVENKRNKALHLYCGFSNETDMVTQHRKFTESQLTAGRLTRFRIALSREADHHYVMDLIEADAAFFADLMKQGGSIMICGSLAMQHDVEKVLDTICFEANGHKLEYYKQNGQLLADCY